MKIRRLHIENFRSIAQLTLELDDTTVLIGANNSGKSAILEALRIALSRRWGQRGTGFTEDDIHIADPKKHDPRSAPGSRIEIVFEETEPDEWPEDMVADLDDIVTLTTDGLNQVAIAISYSWDPDDEAFKPAWEFLNPDGKPMGVRRRSINLSGFYNYVLFYWLGALRDADAEFTARSRYWGGLLKSMNVPPALEMEVKEKLDELDEKLLSSDKRFAEIAETIGRATEIASGDKPGTARLRMLPLNLWDLLSRAGLVLRNEELHPWLPLDHHGQGLQSLAVIFLFQAAIAQALASDLPEGAEPIFAIEEPEVHLHPQAARTLWRRICELPGQSIATTHSPYFVQNVPLHNLRYVRFVDGSTSVSKLKRRVVSDLPWTEEVKNLVAGRRLDWIKKDEKSGTVSATLWFDEKFAADLAACWKSTTSASSMEKVVAEFRHECRLLISKEDEADLALLGRRMRGEIFFARRWVLAEGQSDYLLLHALGMALGYDLDQHGVAVIDFQNNGSPAIYAALADAFEIPWDMIVDGDDEGARFCKQIVKRGFTQAEVDERVTSLTPPHNLEEQLIADGHEALLRDILCDLIGSSAKSCDLDTLKRHLKNRKVAYMTELAPMVAADAKLAAQMPKPFVDLIERLKTRGS